MIEHVLVPLDTSPLAECAVPHAVALAQPFGAEITLLHAMEPPHSTAASSFVDPLDWNLQKVEVSCYLEDMVARLRQANVRAQYVLLDGKPADCIVRTAQSYDQACLVLSSHAQGGMSEWKIGSVAQQIMSRRHVSTMIVRADSSVGRELQSWHYRRVLVPLDGSLRAECVLPLVMMLADFHEAHVILAHVITGPEMPRGILTPHEDLELAHRLTEHRRVDALHYLVQSRAKAGPDTEIRLLMSDNRADTLHKLIEEEKIDLVVMSAHGYSGKAECTYGSLVINFITNCTTSLLIVQDLPEELEPIREEFASRGVQALLQQRRPFGV
jgi:nucleotide-binding universal stress UspA family protein